MFGGAMKEGTGVVHVISLSGGLCGQAGRGGKRNMQEKVNEAGGFLSLGG